MQLLLGVLGVSGGLLSLFKHRLPHFLFLAFPVVLKRQLATEDLTWTAPVDDLLRLTIQDRAGRGHQKRVNVHLEA